MSSSRAKNGTPDRPASPLNLPGIIREIRPTQIPLAVGPAAPGSHNDAGLIRRVLVEAIRASGLSREQIADEMARLVGRRITARMLNGYTAESQEDALFPAELTRAFCSATGDDQLLRCMAELHGLHVIEAEDAELVALGRAFLQRTQADEKISFLERRLYGREV
jgi:hypothetical protein